MIYDLIIVGGGASGIFAASCAPKTKKILILEKMEIPLKKLLISGKGACNFTHTEAIEEFLKNFDIEAQRFLKTSIYNFSNLDCIKFFNKFGLETICTETGKIFPKSMRATAIKDLLLNLLEKNVELNCNCEVEDIAVNEEIFYVECKKAEEKFIFFAKNILIATGGKSFPITGSSGDGYKFAKKFSHSISELKPALASLFCNPHKLIYFSGVSFKHIEVSQFRSGRKVGQFFGDFLITHKGVSGPVIIDNSHNFKKADILKINFTGEDFYTVFEKLKLGGNINIPKKLKNHFEDLLEIKNYSETDYKKLKKLASLFCEYEVVVDGIEGFKSCMATGGGVSLKEVNPKTMESRLQKNLYFAGEILDYVGKTGGYNIQAAFSTGKLAVESMFKVGVDFFVEKSAENGYN